MKLKLALIFLLLALPAFGLSKKPPEPKCDDARSVENLTFTKTMDSLMAVLAGDTAQMSKPKKPQPQAPKADTVFIYKLDPATREWLDYCQREMISMRWYYHTPESLWTAYIKGTHKCPQFPYLWWHWVYVANTLGLILIGLVSFVGWLRRKRSQ